MEEIMINEGDFKTHIFSQNFPDVISYFALNGEEREGQLRWHLVDQTFYEIDEKTLQGIRNET